MESASAARLALTDPVDGARYATSFRWTGVMDIRIYAINLDRSKERWEIVSRQASQFDLTVVRVPGVDGSLVLAGDRIDCDEAAFRRNNGRTILPGEYGCYRSHLAALRRFVDSNEPVGIIVEDDIELRAELPERVAAAFAAVPKMGVIKLYNHRVVGFRLFGTSTFGDEIGRTAHGPAGSAACYAVTHQAATRLLVALARMEYPWDIALERGWATNLSICTFRSNLTVARREDTTIASRSVYKSAKFPWWKRWRTYLHRIGETVRRARYAHCE